MLAGPQGLLEKAEDAAAEEPGKCELHLRAMEILAYEAPVKATQGAICPSVSFCNEELAGEWHDFHLQAKIQASSCSI